MGKLSKILIYGLVLWLVPFFVSFLFVDAKGNFLIPETFFKSIMVVVGALTGVFLAVRYFSTVEKDFFGEGVVIGIAWLASNLGMDLAMVYSGFFKMDVYQYFTDIGLRYLSIPAYVIGMGYALRNKKVQ